MAEKKKWIQKMHMKKGALHKELGVAEDKKIPAKKLHKAAQKSGKLGKRARLAETLKKFSEGGPVKSSKMRHKQY